VAWERTKFFLAEHVGTPLLRMLLGSLRVTVSGEEDANALCDDHPSVVFCSWHNQLLYPTYRRRHTHGVVVISQHADGELIARVAQRLGPGVVRGSTTRGGARALVQLVRLARDGYDIGITPDGPRGPRYIVQPGVVYIAQKAGAPVVPMGFASERYWEFRSWDRFRVPKPWSRAHLAYGEPIHVPKDLDDASVEAWRLRVQAGLMAVTRQAQEAVGLTPEPAEGDHGASAAATESD
jgi:lysophospholipid acyltransferase (LPLAT)-like uncharacterized protein